MICRDCGNEMRVDRTAKGRRTTLRICSCTCGSRWESEERLSRRLPAISSSPVADRSQPGSRPKADQSQANAPHVRASDPDSVSDSEGNQADPGADQTRPRARERTRDGGAVENSRSAQSAGPPPPPNGFARPAPPPAKAITVLMPDGTGSPLWTANHWHYLYARAWRERYGRWLGGTDADARATGGLADTLTSLPHGDLLAAQERAPQMFAEFLADGKPDVVSARHPWSWFVVRWNGLRVAPAPRQRVPSDDGLSARTAARLEAQRVDPSKLPTSAELAALRQEATR